MQGCLAAVGACPIVFLLLRLPAANAAEKLLNSVGFLHQLTAGLSPDEWPSTKRQHEPYYARIRGVF